jgi:hypothetical protein
VSTAAGIPSSIKFQNSFNLGKSSMSIDHCS